MFNRSAYENSRPDGIGVLEIADGDGRDKNVTSQFVPLKRTVLKGQVDGPLATLHLVQSYGYSSEQCSLVLEAFYRFPLPGDAAVTGVCVRFGDVEIRAELKERHRAEEDYDRARKEGRQAALVSRESPDVFTLRIAGLKPDQEITVETDYVQLAYPEGTGWSLRVPLTTSPRYVRSDEVTSRHAQGQPLALLRDPGHRFALDLVFRGAGDVKSTTHALDVRPENGEQHVRLAQGETIPDRDCVMSWRPAQLGDRPSLRVWLHEDPASAQVYYLALVAPPSAHISGQGAPREVILLVDHSGSMNGPKWEAADWAVKRFLSDLAPQDAFNLGVFHSTTSWFGDRPHRASPKEVENAIRFLDTHRDSGGTELGVALEQALSQERTAGKSARHVLVITDAEVSDEGRILRLAEEESARPDRRRVSVLCIDAAPNSFLALELAKRGGGMARFLTSAPEEADVTTALDQILADWAEPVLTGLRLLLDRPRAEASERKVGQGDSDTWSFVDLGDLPSGRPVWVAGRVPRGETDTLTFWVSSEQNNMIAKLEVNLTDASRNHPALKALFGAGRVIGLEFLISSGRDQAEITEYLRNLGYAPEKVLRHKASSKVYAENARQDAEAALRELLVHEALDYGLASSETSFVATRTEKGRLVEGGMLVANALPPGWSADFLAGGAPPSPVAYRAVRFAPAEAMASRPARSVNRALKRIGKRPEPTGRKFVLFSGKPTFANGHALLLDTSRADDAKRVPSDATISKLTVEFSEGTPKEQQIDAGLTLLIFVDDLASPRARVRLVDLIRQGLERPLNLVLRSGQIVVLILEDPSGAWADNAPLLKIAFEAAG